MAKKKNKTNETSVALAPIREEWIGALAVVPTLTLEDLGQLRERARVYHRDLDKERKEHKAPHKEKCDQIDAEYGAMLDTLKAVQDACSRCMNAYIAAQRVETAKVLESGAPSAEALVATAVQLPTQVRLAVEYDFEVVNLDLVPRDYMMVDEKSVKRDIKLGIEIPGIHVIRREEVKTR